MDACGSQEAGLSSETLRALLDATGAALAARGMSVEIALYGGAALALALGVRPSTRDVDFVPLGGPADALEQAAEEAGEAFGLGPGWLSDAVEVFVSDSPDYRLLGDFPAGGAGLRVFAATPEYLLAMKSMALRSSLETSDPEDVWELLGHCGVGTMEEAETAVGRYYPGRAIPRRQKLVLADLIDARARGEGYSRELGW